MCLKVGTPHTNYRSSKGRFDRDVQQQAIDGYPLRTPVCLGECEERDSIWRTGPIEQRRRKAMMSQVEKVLQDRFSSAEDCIKERATWIATGKSREGAVARPSECLEQFQLLEPPCGHAHNTQRDS